MQKSLYVSRRYALLPAPGMDIDKISQVFKMTGTRLWRSFDDLFALRVYALEQRARHSLAGLDELPALERLGKLPIDPSVPEPQLYRAAWVETDAEANQDEVWSLMREVASEEVHEQAVVLPSPSDGVVWNTPGVAAEDDVAAAALERLRPAARHARIVLIDGGVAPRHPALTRGALPADRIVQREAGHSHLKLSCHGTCSASLIAGTGRGKHVRGLLSGLHQLPFIGSITADGRPWQFEAILSALIGLSTWDPDDPTRLVAGPPPGSVLLTEMQGKFLSSDAAWSDQLAPAETHPPVFHAIRLATSLGVTVIEPAGNSGIELPESRDSGAVLVGAGHQGDGFWRRLPSGNYGHRVDCYARGDGLRAAGVHRGIHDGKRRMVPAVRFTHTSAASAFVAAIAAGIQGWRLSRGQPAFGPLALRKLLRSEGVDEVAGLGPRIVGRGLSGI